MLFCLHVLSWLIFGLKNTKRPEADPELPEIEEEVGETFFSQSLSDLVVSKIACSETFATCFFEKGKSHASEVIGESLYQTWN